MKIYIAAFLNSRQNAKNFMKIDFTNPNCEVTRYLDIPYILESYHYIGDPNSGAGEYMRAKGKTIFLDSGAFSMFTQGIEINVKQYGEYVLANKDIFHVASNLDDVTKNEQASWDNQQTLEAMGCAVQPVFHCREDPHWLTRYLDAGYDYIFLGGMVPETTDWLRDWLDNLWSKYLTNKDGMPKVKVHGFGLTTFSLMERYPWYSVDSTSWVMMSSFGNVVMDLPHEDGTSKRYIINFSPKSPDQRNIRSSHFNSLPTTMRDKVLAELARLEAERPRLPGDLEEVLKEMTGVPQGYNPEALGNMYGWRDYANICYFNRHNTDEIKPFVLEQGGLF